MELDIKESPKFASLPKCWQQWVQAEYWRRVWQFESDLGYLPQLQVRVWMLCNLKLQAQYCLGGSL